MSKGDQTRQQIIERAAPLFNQRGFEGCSMKDIMEATGLEKGGIYRHFASKEELAVEVFRYARALTFKARGLHGGEEGSAIVRLRAMVQRFVESPSPLPGGCPLLNTAVDADDGNPVLRDLARETLVQWKQRVAAIVRQGMTAGEIKRSASPQQFANVFVANLEGALMITRLEGNRRALKDVQATLNVILDAMLAE